MAIFKSRKYPIFTAQKLPEIPKKVIRRDSLGFSSRLYLKLKFVKYLRNLPKKETK